MRGMKMINLDDYDIFKDRDYISPLKKTSKDDANEMYMTECTEDVINFDKIVKAYCKKIHIGSIDSNDALMAFTDDENVTFIEFKNGYIDRKHQQKLFKKIYNSILIFSDITKTTISNTRQFMNYILVYNGEKNSDNSNPKTKYRESASRDEISKTLLGYANETYIKYGLEFFKGYCFKDVKTYTKSEFKCYLKNHNKLHKQ